KIDKLQDKIDELQDKNNVLEKNKKESKQENKKLSQENSKLHDLLSVKNQEVINLKKKIMNIVEEYYQKYDQDSNTVEARPSKIAEIIERKK
ncbi:4356_t:CDS:2, partial [Racocetra persica]